MSEADELAGHVFISYVREDSARADGLQRVLEAAGIPVWRDTNDLWPGEDWRANIRQAITSNALVFIACFSQLSMSREKSYQNEELVLAIEQLRRRRPDNPWLIPVRFDGCEIPDLDLGAGRTLASIQRADLFGDEAGENTTRLVAAVLRILKRNASHLDPTAHGDYSRIIRPSRPTDGESFRGNPMVAEERVRPSRFGGGFLIWLSGASPEILRLVPTLRAKYVGNGAAILVAAGIAAISVGFALAMTLRTSIVFVVSFALASGLAIMILDRWLIASMPRRGRMRPHLILALPRLALGLLLALAISTPFVLRIFQPEINQQIAAMHVQRSNQYFAQLKNNSLTEKMNQDDATVNALENIINSGSSSYRDAEIDSLITQRNGATKQANSDYAQWQCQLHAVATGSCKPGDGLQAAATHRRYITAKAELEEYNSRIHALRAEATLSAKADLPTATRAYQQDLSEQNNMTAGFEQANASDTGLLIRLQALDDVTPKNGALGTARTLLFLIFTLIECLPIVVKLLLDLGPQDSYEKILESIEELHLQTVRESNQ